MAEEYQCRIAEARRKVMEQAVPSSKEQRHEQAKALYEYAAGVMQPVVDEIVKLESRGVGSKRRGYAPI